MIVVNGRYRLSERLVIRRPGRLHYGKKISESKDPSIKACELARDVGFNDGFHFRHLISTSENPARDENSSNFVLGWSFH